MSHPIKGNQDKFINVPIVPFPQSNPLNFNDLTASYVVTNNIQNLPNLNVDSKVRSIINKTIKDKWNNLKTEDPRVLKPVMVLVEHLVFKKIEASVLIENILKEEEGLMWVFHEIMEREDKTLLKKTIKEYLPLIATQDRDFLLEERANQLFQTLADLLNIPETLGDVIPVDLASYNYTFLIPNTGKLNLDSPAAEMIVGVLFLDALAKAADQWNQANL